MVTVMKECPDCGEAHLESLAQDCGRMIDEPRLRNRVALEIEKHFHCGPAKAHKAASDAVAAYRAYMAETYMQNTMS